MGIVWITIKMNFKTSIMFLLFAFLCVCDGCPCHSYMCSRYHRHFKKCKNSEICRKTICRDENIFICNIRTRHFERFKVNQTNTEKYKRSAIPYLQILLNDEENQKRQFKRSIGS